MKIGKKSLAINLTSAFRYVRECIPSMKNAAGGESSMCRRRWFIPGRTIMPTTPPPNRGSWDSPFLLTKELGPFGITANVVAPGRIVTDLLTERMAGREQEWMSQTPMRRFGQPEEVAAAIAFLASEAASYITGAVINVNGGLVMG